MPQLDLSDALLEPTFLDRLVVKRRPQNVNNFGEAVIGVATLYAYGTVTIHPDNSLKRGADEQHAPKTIYIVSRFRFRTATNGYQPDVVHWHGSDFMAIESDDYSGYGQGWTQTKLTSRDMMDPPPSPSVGNMNFGHPLNSMMTGVIGCC